MSPSPHYLYGVVAGPELPRIEARGVAEATAAPRALELEGLTALVAPLEGEEVTPSAANLRAHVEVLGQAASATATLPASFGIVAPDEDALRAVLEPRADELRSLLGELGDHVELSVTAAYEGDTAVREAVAAEPEIARLHERLEGVPADAAYWERVRLGELVAQAVARRREAEAEAIVESMRPLATDVVVSDVGDLYVLRAAFLVRRGSLGAFEGRLEEEAAARRGRVRLTLAGPLAPHSFATVPLTAEPVA